MALSRSHRNLLLIAALGWTLAVFIGISIPSDGLPETTLWSFDKVIHFTLFAVLGALWMVALAGRPLRRRARWVLAGGVAYAIFTELWQGILPTRATDPFDALANTIGLVTAVVTYVWLLRRRQRRRNA